MKLKMLLMATALLLPMSSVFAETTDDYVVGLKKEASIGNTEAQKELVQFQELCKKANTGDAQAQYDLGMFYYNKAEKYYKTVFSHNDDYEQKLQEWLGKAANQGNEKAQHELIEYYKKILKKIDYRFNSSEEQARVSRYKKTRRVVA
ncbi:unnamed protein product [Commensalibacter communis]|uniref:Sel1 repeat family protein n=1 Tax=Commensalibacter communis TaxID=2972786 RepID=A0A9W4TQF2_9PROT|nr:hypothetical protein [Commensalibacter communis]CAI3949187.1 unnamed protein product [Commensalibacter communis]CAI3950701.1 unnamed protein product [Commensalibacter communis]CAI3952309.1 unnamed protein product [Commensalibacter communis]CAI3953436.1 unnamed protein product [Commensalibacter communis]